MMDAVKPVANASCVANVADGKVMAPAMSMMSAMPAAMPAATMAGIGDIDGEKGERGKDDRAR